MDGLLYTGAMNPDGTGASFRELSAWAQLVSLTVAYVAVVAVSLAEPTNALRLAVACAGGLVLLVAAMIVTHSILAASTRQQPDDERDIQIRLRSSRYADILLAVGVLLAFNTLLLQQIVGGAKAPDWFWFHPLFTGHLLLFSLFLSEFARLITQAVCYRRG